MSGFRFGLFPKERALGLFLVSSEFLLHFALSFQQIPEPRQIYSRAFEKNRYVMVAIQILGGKNRVKGEINPTNIKTYHKDYII